MSSFVWYHCNFTNIFCKPRSDIYQIMTKNLQSIWCSNKKRKRFYQHHCKTLVVYWVFIEEPSSMSSPASTKSTKQQSISCYSIFKWWDDIIAAKSKLSPSWCRCSAWRKMYYFSTIIDPYRWSTQLAGYDLVIHIQMIKLLWLPIGLT